MAIVEARVSEDELAVYEAAISYALDSLNGAEIESRFGASVEELEGMRDDLRAALEQHGEVAGEPEPLETRK